MIRPRSRQLKIGWIIPTVGTFGAVREMVEVSNVLTGLGHYLYIYHPDGSPCKWLNSTATYRKLGFLDKDNLDVLIGIVDWQPELYEDLLRANAKQKAICLLGFEPTELLAKILRGEVAPADNAQKIIVDAMHKNFLILADSSWQVDWMVENTGYAAGPAFGGVNLAMFYPVERPENKKIKIIYSGDPRERKGTDTVEQAIATLKKRANVEIDFEFYWHKRFSQPNLVKFIQSADIFLDGHRRAGWCNPVAEAIACGVVPVATDIGANRDFAIHEQTALIIPVNDPDAMADQAMRLINLPELRQNLVKNGLRHIQRFSYDKVVRQLEEVLKQSVYDHSTSYVR